MKDTEWFNELEYYLSEGDFTVKCVVFNTEFRLYYFSKSQFKFSCYRIVSYNRAKVLTSKKLYFQI